MHGPAITRALVAALHRTGKEATPAAPLDSTLALTHAHAHAHAHEHARVHGAGVEGSTEGPQAVAADGRGRRVAGSLSSLLRSRRHS